MLDPLAHGLEFHGPGWLDTEQLLLGVGAHRDGSELLLVKVNQFTT